MKLKLLLITIALFVVCETSWGQIAISSSTPITQNFTLGTTATASLPANWKMSDAGATSPTWAAAGNFTATTVQASSGNPNTGGRYNWGNGTTTTDRAIGFMTSSGYNSPNSVMAFYQNTSGVQINDIVIAFDYERYRINSAACSITFFTSTDGTTWTARTTGDSGAFTTGTSAYNFTTGTVITKSVTLTGINIANGGNFYLRWNFDTIGTNSQGVGLDNVSLTATLAVAGPTITSSPATLTAFTYVYGSGPSVEQSFTVSGNSLTNNLVVTPSTNYEISTGTGGAFVATNPITFTPSSGTVTSKTIYTRLKTGLSVASYNSEGINITSTGATAKTVTCSGSVTAKLLTVTGYSGTDKIYDRLTTATLAGTGALVGVVGGDVVSLSGTESGTFATKNVGVGKTITITGLSLTGAAAGNYTLTLPSTTATITAKALTVTGAIASSKVYDRTNNATITASTLVGVIGGDTVTIAGTGTFASINVGTGIAITSTQTLSGADAGNYTITLPVGLSANITAKPLTITGVTASNKVYDGNTTATLSGTAVLSGVIAADNANITLNISLATATFANATIGTGKAVTVTGYTISGSASGNYSLTQPTGLTANITASLESDLVVTGIQPATISSLINNVATLTSTTGIEVLQFKVRDGGSDLTDSDTLPTILNSFTIAQVANTVTTWSDAIQTVALFDGTTFLATGTVTATQIQFTGLNITAADNTEKTLSIRLSLKNPLGADAFDGEYFGFSISNANTTFSGSGSGEASFTAVANSSGTNIIDVTATKLLFTTQPTNTAINSGMNAVIVKAYDTNNNLDLSYTGIISMTSTGTENAITPKAATAGAASFSGITHTALGTGLMLSAGATGLSTATSSAFDIVLSTNLTPGDLAILTVNTSGTDGDQIAFVCFTNIASDTKLYLTDNGYERKTAGEWGNTEGVITIKRTGPSLPQGTIIMIESNVGNNNINLGTKFNVFVCGVNDNANWTRGFEGGGSGFNLNSDDDIWIMQGGTWSDGTTGSHDATFSGTVLYGWTESGWNDKVGLGLCINGSADANDCTRWSTIYPSLECYNTVAPVGAGKVKFNDPNNPDFSMLTNGKLDWIALINNTANWDTYSDNTTYNAGGYDYLGNTTCPAMTIVSDTYINGKWTGKKDTNWFNCGNWDTLVVPDETVDVQVGDNTFDHQAIVDATAPFASSYGSIAKAKDLIVTGEKVELVANVNNKLEVHGNLLINTAGELDMDDSTTAADGQIYLYGNWTNSMGTNAFQEGNGTVKFLGTSAQIINNNVHTNPEGFYNVVLDNNFVTSVSNNLIANGDLTINSGKTVTVSFNDYIKIQNNLTVNGFLNIQNRGSLVQVNDTFTNSGNITYERRSNSDRDIDYTYWSTPVSSSQTLSDLFPQTLDGMYYSFDTTLEDWNQETSSTTMDIGKGYIVRGPELIGQTPPSYPIASFYGTPNNGSIPVPIIYNGAIDGTSNLIGNPYPSALSADKFLDLNSSVIEGTIYFWTHNTDLQLRTDIIASGATPGSGKFAYTSNDYASYNFVGGVGTGTGTGTGTAAPSGSTGGANNSIPNGFIAAGQAFFATSLKTAPSTTAFFNNSMRVDNSGNITDNSQFFKTRSPKTKSTIIEKHRIWLNLSNAQGAFKQTLVGYITDATNECDSRFDGESFDANEFVDFYSVNQDKNLVIQGRKLPFDENDEVPLGFRTTVEGAFAINIDQVDGVLTNQAVFIEDKLTNTVFDLKGGNYTFNTVAGTFNDRFILRYTNKTLGTADLETLEKQVLVSNKNKQIKVNSAVEMIDKVLVYDLLGRLIFKKEKVNSNEFSILNLVSSQQTVLVKVSLQNGQTVTKKIIF
jgi:hypothetical protein